MTKFVPSTHDLDQMFDVPKGRTVVAIPDGASEDVPTTSMQIGNSSIPDDIITVYDDRDQAITDNLDTIQKRAVEAYEVTMVSAQTVVDKRATPELLSAAAQFLSIALDATKEKSVAKGRKDKVSVAKHVAMEKEGTSSRSHITNNIVTDRETAMKLIRARQSTISDGTKE